MCVLVNIFKASLPPHVGILIGIFLLLACQNVLDFDLLWKLLVPVIIAVFGVKMILRGIVGNKSSEIMKTTL